MLVFSGNFANIPNEWSLFRFLYLEPALLWNSSSNSRRRRQRNSGNWSRPWLPCKSCQHWINGILKINLKIYFHFVFFFVLFFENESKGKRSKSLRLISSKPTSHLKFVLIFWPAVFLRKISWNFRIAA